MFFTSRNTPKIPYSLNPVNKDKKFGLNLVIWGKFYEVIYMGGRQILNRQEEVHKREELKIK